MMDEIVRPTLVSAIGAERSEMLTSDYNYAGNLKVDELKNVIRSLNTIPGIDKLPISGNKPDLIKRVKDALSQLAQPGSRVGSKRALPPAKAAPPPKYFKPAEGLKAVRQPNRIQIPELDIQQFDHFQNPFYKEVKKVAIIPFGGAGYETNNQRKCLFDLTPSQLQEIQLRKVFLHLRLFSPAMRADLEFTSPVQLNGRPLDILRKKTRTAPTKTPFVTPHPPKVDPVICKGSNIVTFSQFGQGFLVIQLVVGATMKEIMENVHIKEITIEDASNEDELAEVSCKVGVRCPLGFVRIETPAKGKNCKHVQCFDLESYLSFCKQQLIWYCPICYKNLPYSELSIDEYFKTILNASKDEEDDDVKVEILPDGKFKLCLDVPLSPDSQEQNSQTSQPQSQNIMNSHHRTGPPPPEQIMIVDSDEESDLPPPSAAAPFQPVRPPLAVPPLLAEPRLNGQSSRQQVVIEIDDDDDDDPKSADDDDDDDDEEDEEDE